MKIREKCTCPLELVHDMLKGKWKSIILWCLKDGPTSLTNLERDIEGISQKMLLQHLRELMEFGFVEKRTFDGYPLKVEYYLTEDMGFAVIDALRIYQQMGIRFMKENGMEEVLKEKGLV